MKKLATLLVSAAVGSISFSVSTTAAETSGKLSGRQIREKLAGMQLSDEVHWRDVYDRDGTLKSYSESPTTRPPSNIHRPVSNVS
jgi:hypothetical protein